MVTRSLRKRENPVRFRAEALPLFNIDSITSYMTDLRIAYHIGAKEHKNMKYSDEEINAEVERRLKEREAHSPPTATSGELKDLEKSVRSKMEGTTKKAWVPLTNEGEKRLATTKVFPWMTVSSFLVPRVPKEKVAVVLEVRASVLNPETKNWCSRTVARVGFDSKAEAIKEAKALRAEVLQSKVRTAGKKAPATRIRHILKTLHTAASVSCVGGTASRRSSTRKRVSELFQKNANPTK